jgi:hypothetical protein
VLDEACTAPNKVFPGKLGFVDGFRARIFMLHLMNFPMHIPPRLVTGGAANGFYRAGLFRGLLCRQFLTGGIQLFTALFHTEL